MIATSSASGIIFPLWVEILKALGIPTLVGTMLGLFFSYLLFKVQTQRDDRRRKEEIAKQIISEVYSYNVAAVNEYIFDIEHPNAKAEEIQEAHIRFTIAAKSFNEAIALADLFLGNEAVEILVNILTAVKGIADEIRSNPNKSLKRSEIKAGKEYDEFLKRLREILKNWMK